MWTLFFFCFVGLGDDGTVFCWTQKRWGWFQVTPLWIYILIYLYMRYIYICRYHMYILPVYCIYLMSSSSPKISFGVKESHWSEQACTGIGSWTSPPHDLILHHFAPSVHHVLVLRDNSSIKKDRQILSLQTVSGPQHVVCFSLLTLRRYLLHAFEALQKPGSEEISAVMSSTSRVFGDFFLVERSEFLRP